MRELEDDLAPPLPAAAADQLVGAVVDKPALDLAARKALRP